MWWNLVTLFVFLEFAITLWSVFHRDLFEWDGFISVHSSFLPFFLSLIRLLKSRCLKSCFLFKYFWLLSSRIVSWLDFLLFWAWFFVLIHVQYWMRYFHGDYIQLISSNCPGCFLNDFDLLFFVLAIEILAFFVFLSTMFHLSFFWKVPKNDSFQIEICFDIYRLISWQVHYTPVQYHRRTYFEVECFSGWNNCTFYIFKSW